MISFVSQYKWGILPVAIGIILLIRIDLVASLIAVTKSKIGKGFDKKGEVIDAEYNVIEKEEEDNN